MTFEMEGPAAAATADGAMNTGVESPACIPAKEYHRADETATSVAARVTIITSRRPERLGKLFRMDGDKVVKENGGNMVTGVAEVREVRTLADLSAILTELTPAQALTYGIAKNGAPNICTKDAKAKKSNPAIWASRTRDDFAWHNGPGVMMLDYDPTDGVTPMSRDELIAAIRKVAPEVGDADMLWFPSASSCIWHGDVEVRGIMGQRLYVMVQNAADIPRAGKVLTERLWLCGYGRYDVSAAGALLDRALFDASVWQPERLDFAGGSVCLEGLDQRRGDPVLIRGTFDDADTATALPNLSRDERAKLDELQAAAKAGKADEVERVRGVWVEERAKEMMRKAGANLSDEAEWKPFIEAARNILESESLTACFVLHIEGDGRVTVGEVLADPLRYHGKNCRDPMEPGYDGGRYVGKIYSDQDRPMVHTFAHGGRNYRLSSKRVWLRVTTGETASATDATLKHLRGHPFTFDLGGQLVRVSGDTVFALDTHTTSHHLAGLIEYTRPKKEGNATVDVLTDPPDKMVQQILSLGAARGLKRLTAVSTVPMVRPDGSLIGAGYDADTGILLRLPEDAQDIPTSPTVPEAQVALETLLWPFRFFPLVDGKSRGALLAALLTAVVRPVLPTAPGFGFDAPAQGGGKTLLASAVGALATGLRPGVTPYQRDEDELRKALVSDLREGAKTFIFDNIIGTFDSAALAAAMTSGNVRGRILGKSESTEFPNRALMMFTGNNLTLGGDMPRRILIARIDPETPTPFARQFDFDPVEHVLTQRAAMAVAAGTLMRARFVHPYERGNGRMASFEEWDDLVRQTVIWCNEHLTHELGDFTDPMELVREAQANDPEAEVWGGLLDALATKWPGTSFAAGDVVKWLDDWGAPIDVKEAMSELAPGSVITSSKTVGRILAYRKGRIVNGKRLVYFKDPAANAGRFRVEDVTSN